MADPLNPSFEIAGTNPGEAQDWTPLLIFHGWTLADFSGIAGTTTPIESFEHVPYYRTIIGGVLAPFIEGPTQGTLESFDFWSGNTNYHVTIPTGSVAQFTGGVEVETFDEPLATYTATVSGGTSFADTFNEPLATYSSTVSGGTAATYYQGSATIESFQGVQADVVFSVPVPGNNTLVTTTPHGLANGVKMTIRSTGSPPGGLTTNAEYYVVNTASLTLKLSLTLGGTAITTTSSGVGTHRLHADETLYWTDGS